MTINDSTLITAEPGKMDMTMTREFDAPRELVFTAFTDPEMYAQWIGPRRLTTHIDKFEAYNGGRWRYISRDTDGSEYGFHGVFHEVTAPQRLVQTFEFEGMAGFVNLETMSFEELPDGRTRCIGQSVFQSVAARDGALQSGMENGMRESFERLDDLLVKVQL